MIDCEEEFLDAVPRRRPPEPPSARDVVAAVLVFVALPCMIALATVGAYVASGR